MRRRGRQRSVRIIAGAAVVLLGMLAGMNCSFQGGVLTGDGGTSTKSFGHTGADDRFTWGENEVVDRQTGIAWDRQARQRLSYAGAVRFCAAGDARLPTRGELDGMAEFFASDLFEPGAPSDDSWSSSEAPNGARFALGRSGVRALSTDATAVVRCVRPLH